MYEMPGLSKTDHLAGMSTTALAAASAKMHYVEG